MVPKLLAAPLTEALSVTQTEIEKGGGAQKAPPLFFDHHYD
jgi:hypothetical protein